VVLLWQIRAVREGSSTVVTDSIIRLLGAHRKPILNMAIPRLTNEIIDAAILGFEEQKRRLDAQLAELRAMRNGASQTAPASARPRRKMSAAGRKAIAAAQRQRWATLKGAVGGEKGRQEELAERRPVAGYRYRYVDLTDRQRIEQEVGLECRKARRGRSWAGKWWWSKNPRGAANEPDAVGLPGDPE
jgi:hypothetical protein